MKANTTTKTTNEMLFEQLIEIKSMLSNLQVKINSLKNPVDDFTSKWVDTFDVMRMLRVSRRTMDNYIKVGKLTRTRINKRNYFAIAQVNGLMHFTKTPKVRAYHEDIKNIHEKVNQLSEEGVEW